MIWHHGYESGVEPKRGRVYRAVVHVTFGAAVAALIALVFGYFVMLLWNGDLPHVTAAQSISYWQAVRLLVLARILVGGLKGHGGGHHVHDLRRGRRPRHEHDQWWKEVGNQMSERLEGTPRESRHE